MGGGGWHVYYTYAYDGAAMQVALLEGKRGARFCKRMVPRLMAHVCVDSSFRPVAQLGSRATQSASPLSQRDMTLGTAQRQQGPFVPSALGGSAANALQATDANRPSEGDGQRVSWIRPIQARPSTHACGAGTRLVSPWPGHRQGEGIGAGVEFGSLSHTRQDMICDESTPAAM